MAPRWLTAIGYPAQKFGWATLQRPRGVVNVGDWRPIPVDAQIIPAKGVMYSVGVRVVANSGTLAVNVFHFAARAVDGRLTAGQAMEGHVAIDRAPGNTVTGIVQRDPAGKQHAFWTVN